MCLQLISAPLLPSKLQPDQPAVSLEHPCSPLYHDPCKGPFSPLPHHPTLQWTCYLFRQAFPCDILKPVTYVFSFIVSLQFHSDFLKSLIQCTNMCLFSFKMTDSPHTSSSMVAGTVVHQSLNTPGKQWTVRDSCSLTGGLSHRMYCFGKLLKISYQDFVLFPCLFKI